MASDSSKSKSHNESRLRATAIQHARMIEEKKQLRNRIADFVVECFGLPTEPASSPAKASAQDIDLFKESLNLFQPSDFDDLILERNIDGRCGYALCSNPNQKAAHGGKHVWSKEARFFVDKAEFERWCSTQCKDRGVFVRVQLSIEPAWLREGKPLDVRLLDEVARTETLSDALKDLALSDAKTEEATTKLKNLSLERGDGGQTNIKDIQILENDTEEATAPTQQGMGDFIEGLPARNRSDAVQ